MILGLQAGHNIVFIIGIEISPEAYNIYNDLISVERENTAVKSGIFFFF